MYETVNTRNLTIVIHKTPPEKSTLAHRIYEENITCRVIKMAYKTYRSEVAWKKLFKNYGENKIQWKRTTES